MLHTWSKGLEISDESLALESIAEVLPGGHHLGTAHTMRNFRTAFYRAELFDYTSSEVWTEAGSADAYARANKRVKHLLASYEPPALDVAKDEALTDFMARRKTEFASQVT
jgi:trimethylamine--corrinoid protein Co-methyltransferase